MNNLYVLVGLPFSGKTTLSKKIAEHTKSQIVSFDNLLFENEEKLGIKRNPEGWSIIRNLAQEKIKSKLTISSVIYDDISMLYTHREQLRKIAKESRAGVVIIYVKTPLELIKKRQQENLIRKEREDNIPENFQLILNQFEEPSTAELPIIYTPETQGEDFFYKLP